MAEDVFIEGGNWPAWATESTQSSILTALQALNVRGLNKSDMQKLIAAIGKGDKDVADILKNIQAEDKEGTKSLKDAFTKANENITKLREEGRRSESERDKDAASMQQSMTKFSELMSNIRDGLDSNQITAAEAMEEMKSSFKDADSEMVSGVISALGALITFSNGVNQFVVQLGEDRFNLANEIRQSGLAATLNDLDSSMMGFAEMVNQTSFTLGQAAKFTEQFSQAVGGLGVRRSLELVQDLAYGGADGADMMRRFGLEFGGVAEVAGSYLESVRNLGMLDRMNDQQLRAGMSDFMDTVTVTSNVLKIGLQESAEMIANTLGQRDDLTVMLAGLPADLRGSVDDAVAAFGGQNNQFAESIAQYVAAGGMQGFVQTEQGAALQGSAFGQEFLPLLQRIGDQILSGGDLGQILANSEGEIGRLTGLLQDSGFRAQALQGQDQMLNQLAAALIRMQDTIGDANAGNRADTTRTGMEDDAEFVAALRNRQQAALAREDIENSIATVFNYAENLGELNRSNAELIESIQNNVGPAIESFGGETLFDVTTFVDTTVKDVITTFVNIIGEAGDIISNKFEGLREEEQRQQQQFAEDAGITAEAEAQRELQTEQERAIGNDGQGTRSTIGQFLNSNAEREAFDPVIIADAIERGQRAIDYEFIGDDGNATSEMRINTDSGAFDGPSYVALETPEQQTQYNELLARHNAIQEATNTLLGNLGARNRRDGSELLQQSGVGAGFGQEIISLLTDTRSTPEQIAANLANELGVDSRYNDTTQGELEFVAGTLDDLRNRGIMDNNTINELVTVLQGIKKQITDDPRSFITGGQRVTDREAGEIQSLIVTLQGLTNTLNQQ